VLPEVEQWIEEICGGYAWPGNYREFGAVRANVIIRRSYERGACAGRGG